MMSFEKPTYCQRIQTLLDNTELLIHVIGRDLTQILVLLNFLHYRILKVTNNVVLRTDKRNATVIINTTECEENVSALAIDEKKCKKSEIDSTIASTITKIWHI